MIIGIDIDDTITNSSDMFVKFAKFYNKKNKIKFKINNKVLDPNKAFGWNTKIQNDFLKKYLKTILLKAKVKKDVCKNIYKLQKLGHKIYFITARSDLEIKNMYLFTKKWLTANRINFDKLFVNCLSKADACIKNNVDIFIDDNFKNCKDVYEKLKIPVFLFDTRYNRNVYDLLMERVSNWNKIYNKIKKLNLGEKL